MNVRRTVVATLVLAGALSACGGSTSSSGSATTITLYNAQHEQTTDALLAAFTKQTGIKVKVDDNDEDVLTAQIEQEGPRSPADVVYTENANWLAQLDAAHLLAAVPASTLAQVPAADSAADGHWVGVSARVSAIVYDPAKISASQLPTTVVQMADAKYKGMFEIAPSETDFWPVVSSVARADGRVAALQWLNALKSNAGGSGNVPDNETLTSDVSGGTADFALINTYYFYRARAEVGAGSMHARLAYFSDADPGYVEGISGAAELASSKHPAAAEQLLAFLTGQAGQTELAKSNSFEYPLAAGVAANAALPPLSSLHPNDFTAADLGTGLDAKSLLQQAGLL